ncbi:MAG: ABC transporter ATP-binding protein [Clostridia bacterium]|nr:ABC transporter ATP-binding protein [Clostridia bacterium]
MIEFINLTKKFGDFSAIDEVNAKIKDGSIYGLVGSNGSGKSTLLRLLSGVYYPDGGNISVDGFAVFNNPELKQQIFYLPDAPYFFKNATIKEMADFYEGIYETFDRARFDHLKDVFPISTTNKIDNMSKGMQRQAALMLALSTNPKYLLLDEAFDGLDPVMRSVLKELLIDGIETNSMTVIIASHNLRELEDLCDHVALIHKGKILFSDSLEDVRSNFHKIQAAFKVLPPEIKLHDLDIIKCDKVGSLLQMVIRGEEKEIMDKINSLDPIFAEIIEPTLEEIFMYEMEAVGYDIKNLLS